MFDLYTDGRIPREAIPVVATRMAKDGLSAADGLRGRAASRSSGATCGPRELDGLAWTATSPAKVDSRDKRLRFLAGTAIEQLKGRAPAKDVAAYLVRAGSRR